MVDESRWKYWQDELARLEVILHPIAERKIDFTDPDWQSKVMQVHPLDEAGIRSDAQALLLDMLAYYPSATDEERSLMRMLLTDHYSFTWATPAPRADSPQETVRRQLMHFSLEDQERDARDALMYLEQICQTDDVTPAELKAMRSEVAAISSDENRYGWGTTRQFLLSYRGQHCAASAPEPSA
jgi:hypothetical protein